MRHAVVLAVLLAGCATTEQAREQASTQLDQAERILRDARVSYQQRMDRIATEWLCSGMSWPSLLEAVGGDRELLDAVMRRCAERTFPTMEER